MAFYHYNPDSRIFEYFLTGGTTSGSARYDLMMYSFSAVFSDFYNFIFGDYASYVVLGGVGAYPHNLFSVWHNFGFVFFLIYVFILFNAWCVFLSKMDQANKNSMVMFLMILIFLLSFALIISKDHSYMLFGLVMGLLSNHRIKAA